MRFSTVTFIALAVGIVAASPIPDLVTSVGDTVHKIDDSTGVTGLEDDLNTASGGALYDLEDKLGVTELEKVTHITRRGDIQTIGKGVKSIEDGAGITATEDFINSESGGALDALDDALGVTTLEKAIGAN